MELLYYSSKNKGQGERVQRIIAGLVPQEHLKIYRTMESLSLRLRQFRGDLFLAVILLKNRNELLDILSIRDLLDGIRIILILPDRENTTIAKGYKLYPRFVSYADSDFTDVAAVLEKMLKHLGSTKYQYQGGEEQWQS